MIRFMFFVTLVASCWQKSESFASPATFKRSSITTSPCPNSCVRPLAATPDRTKGVRPALRSVTGFSWTAFRATMRAATGISLTAVYATTLAASGQWVRQTMRFVLSLLPAWARYFVQPILVLYYTPLFILRSMTGPQRLDRHVVDGWKEAVERADGKSDKYWPSSEE